MRLGQEVQAVPRQALSPARVRVVVGLIENAAGQLLVNRRPRGHMAGLWEFPGGKRKPAEARLTALCRELEEELGITVTAARPFLVLHHDYADRHVELDVWLVETFEGTPRSREAQELRWAGIDDFANLELLAADAPIVTAWRQLSISPKGTSFVDCTAR